MAEKFTWTINNFSKLTRVCLHYSHTFFTGPYSWRIGFVGRGSILKFMLVYLYDRDNVNFPVQRRSASVKLSLVNHLQSNRTIIKEIENIQLNEGDNDACGYSSIAQLFVIHNPGNGFFINDTCVVVAEVSVNDLGLLDRNHPNSVSTSSLIDFKGLCKIEKEYVEVLEESCSKHPSLIECHRNRNRSERFNECSFTALGKLLHFLKTKKVKDMMSDDACMELQDLWDEVEIRFDDLSWLEPHVKSALTCSEKAAKVEKLKGDVADLEENVKNLKAKAIALDADLEKTKKELAMAKEGFDLDYQLGCGIP